MGSCNFVSLWRNLLLLIYSKLHSKSFDYLYKLNRELKQPRRRRQQKQNLHIWQWKTVFLHALHVHFSSFDILMTFSFFLRREMTCFAVVWTTGAYNDKCSILSSYVPSARSILIPMTLNNWKMIAETRSYIFRCRSCFRRRRVCLSSQIKEIEQPLNDVHTSVECASVMQLFVVNVDDDSACSNFASGIVSTHWKFLY